MLRGSAHPDREVAEITFNFWYILSEELAGGGRMLEPVDTAAAFASGSAPRPSLPQPWARARPLILGSGPTPFEATRWPSSGRPETEDLRPNPLAGMLEPPQRAAARQLFAPAFVQLVDSLRLLVMLPADSDSWSVDDRDDFKRFRYSVGDVLSDACKVLGSVQCLERVFTVLQAREI